MKEESLMKLQYLIEGLTGKNIPLDILKSIENDKVSMKDFQKKCRKNLEIPLPHDPRSEKYKDIPLYSMAELQKKFMEKYPEKIDVRFEPVDIAFLKELQKDGGEDISLIGTIEDTPKRPVPEDRLEMELTVRPDEREYYFYPLESEYMDEEMDAWIEDCIEQEAKSEYSIKESNSSNYIKRHPDLTGGKLWFYLEEKNERNLRIEGRPVHEALAIVYQKPDISIPELKDMLHNEEKRRWFFDEMAEKNGNKVEMRINKSSITYHQPGKAGYVRVHSWRSIDSFGEPLDEGFMRKLQEDVKNKELIVKGEFFFNNFAKNTENRTYMNRNTGEIKRIRQYVSFDDKPVYVSGYWPQQIVDEKEMKDMLDIEGRVTDLVVKDNIYETLVRCKVDGVQQGFEKLTSAQHAKLAGFRLPEEKEIFLLDVMAKRHMDLLTEQEVSRERGMKM